MIQGKYNPPLENSRWKVYDNHIKKRRTRAMLHRINGKYYYALYS